jgi:adenine deaminase
MDQVIAAARGEVPADLLFTDAELFNPFTCSWESTSFGVKDGIVLGTGAYHARQTCSLKHARVVPGLIDAHVHVESSLLTPYEYARLVSSHGTTTVIADPHEIANVLGSAGIRYMLAARPALSIDLRIMLPSCVPATPDDPGGAVLNATDLKPFLDMDGVVGIGEMMNVPGVIGNDPEVARKCALSPIVDGHAPLLSGHPLDAYVLAGIQSDHECTSAGEARERLSRGMYLYLREGSTEQNLKALAEVVTRCTVPRCSFATDDRHADLLAKTGHIDDCIRKAVEYGVDPDDAIRMATLSPAERFRLTDRGALAPGRRADFCVLEKGSVFTVRQTFRGGRPADAGVREMPPIPHPVRTYACTAPDRHDLTIRSDGPCRVIGLVPGQILTSSLVLSPTAGIVPDLDLDILKIVVCDAYRGLRYGVGLVHGFGITSGAIATSVAHDAHNIIAVGTSDEEITRAIDLVIGAHGALTAVLGERTAVLPLECAGLMSVLPYRQVVADLDMINDLAADMGGIRDPFMYLSFLGLPVIPHLRITPGGLFDVDAQHPVPLRYIEENEWTGQKPE